VVASQPESPAPWPRPVGHRVLYAIFFRRRKAIDDHETGTVLLGDTSGCVNLLAG